MYIVIILLNNIITIYRYKNNKNIKRCTQGNLRFVAEYPKYSA